MKETITAKELEEAMNAVLKQARKMEDAPTLFDLLENGA